MLALLLCVAAAAVTWFATRRNLVTGLLVLLGIGYLYGIVRANVPETFSHFIFDGSVAGLYASAFFGRRDPIHRAREAPLRPWMLLLIGWPIVLALIPVQHPLVQLVGLRGAVFMVPFALIGARLDDADLQRLAAGVAALNIAAFAVAVAEFFIGLELFFPRNEVTELIYRSRDVAGATAHRIPSTFTSAHAYAATMAASSALLVGAWMHPRTPHRMLLAAGVVASLVGVFMAAARTHMLVIGVIVVAATVSGRVRATTRVSWLLAIGVCAFVIAQSERMQRFRSLQDTEYVSDRISTSVNASFFDLAREYPMGVGLGGGGTSMPYFLRDKIQEQVGLENEYGRIMLEQGLAGLLAWLAFLGWVFTRRARRSSTRLQVAARLTRVACAAYFASAVTGTGLLTSVPLTVILLLYIGWICALPVDAALAGASAPAADRAGDASGFPAAAATRFGPARS